MLSFSACGLITAVSGVAAETRGYVFSMIHTATYGDKSNCPAGGNGGPPEIKKRIFMRQGYTAEQAAKIVALGGGRVNNIKDDNGKRVEFVERGRYKGKPADIADFPASVPDPHIETVSGKLAYGFNLNGKVEDGAFEDPDTHEKGVDNNLWRVLGCFDMYNIRLPIRPYSEEFSWDTAIDSMPAWLLSISGTDLSRDGDVTVTFDRSLNILIRDTKGGVMPNATFVIDQDLRDHHVFKGHIKSQVLTIEPGPLSLQGESQFYPILRFTHTQARLKLNADGSLSGLLGGYQPWADYYAYLAVRSEDQSHVDLPGVYYAFKKWADGPYDPVTDEGSISTAYWMEAVPSFNTTLSKKVAGKSPEPASGR